MILSDTDLENTMIEMAKIKLKIKFLEKKYKKLETDAIEYGFDSYTVPKGTFTMMERKNYQMNNCKIAKEITFKLFKEFAKISRTGIIKAVGEDGFSKLIKKEAVVEKKSTYYLRFNAAK